MLCDAVRDLLEPLDLVAREVTSLAGLVQDLEVGGIFGAYELVDGVSVLHLLLGVDGARGQHDWLLQTPVEADHSFKQEFTFYLL